MANKLITLNWWQQCHKSCCRHFIILIMGFEALNDFNLTTIRPFVTNLYPVRIIRNNCFIWCFYHLKRESSKINSTQKYLFHSIFYTIYLFHIHLMHDFVLTLVIILSQNCFIFCYLHRFLYNIMTKDEKFQKVKNKLENK